MIITTASRTVSIDEWRAEGERRFGPQPLQWKFTCPACGHVQCPEDFGPYKERGATVETARHTCIGRYAGAKRNAGLNGTGRATGPCDYTSGGLFDLRPVTVTFPDGTSTKAFDFAPQEAA